MKKDTQNLAEDARALLSATSDVAGDKIDGIRKRITDTLKHESKIQDRVRDRVVKGSRAVDKAMHTSPYQAAAIGVTCGLFLGFLASRKFTCENS